MHNGAIADIPLPMSIPSPAPPARRSAIASWLPGRLAWLWVVGAAAVGLLLFLLVMTRGSDRHEFYRAGETPPTAAVEEYAALPIPAGGETGLAPSPAAAPTDTGTGTGTGDRPYIVEPAPAPASSDAIAAPAAQPPMVAAEIAARPIAGRTPAPRYPRQALRRGESGVVLVRAEIGPDGVPTSVSVANSSHSRLLDRAAVEAVRRWRFEPARRGGQPIVGTVTVPIAFNPEG